MFFLVIMNVERFREKEQLVNAWDRNRKLTKTSISKTLLFNAAVELDIAAFKKTDVLNNSTWSRSKKNPLLGNNYQDFQNSIKLNWASSSRFWWGGHQYQMEWSVLFCESLLYLRNWWRCYKLKVGDSYFCAQGNLFDCADIWNQGDLVFKLLSKDLLLSSKFEVFIWISAFAKFSWTAHGWSA